MTSGAVASPFRFENFDGSVDADTTGQHNSRAGLLAVAYRNWPMRPASNASLPAITAWRMAHAMVTLSWALATAVLRSTPSYPNSIAIAASEAVPTPA